MSEPIDKPRCVRIITEWEGYTSEMVEEQAKDRGHSTIEDALAATAETYADLKAMKGLREHLERDCE